MSFWAAGATLFTLIGAGYSAYSSYQAGQQSQAINDYNARQQEGQNANELALAAAKSLSERQENDRVLASQEAAFAASGVVTNTGSPLLLKTKQAAALERRAVNTDYEGAIASRVGAGRVRNFQMEGAAAAQAGKVNAIGTLLSGAGQAASNYRKTGSGLGPAKASGKKDTLNV